MSEQDNNEVTAAIERYIVARGWWLPDMALTDVLVVAVTQGFDPRGVKSRTFTVVPTDSAVPMVVGMARSAQIRYEQMIAGSFIDPEEE